MPSSNAQQPAQVTDPPVSPTKTAVRGPAAGQAAKDSGGSPTPTGRAAVAPGPWDRFAGKHTYLPNTKSSDLHLPQVPSGDPVASALEDPQQGDHSEGNGPNPVNKATVVAFVTNPPAANRGPYNANDESAAQMSALHKALGPAPSVSPQGQLKTNQPAANQPASPPVQPNAVVAPDSSNQQTKNGAQFLLPIPSDPQRSGPSKPFPDGGVQLLLPVSSDRPDLTPDSSSLSVENGVQSPQPVGSDKVPPKSEVDNSPPSNTGTFPVTIRLGLQTGSKPATIPLGSEMARESTNSGSVANNNGDAVSAASLKDGSGTKTSVTDGAYKTVIVAGNTLGITDPSSVSIAGTVLTPGGAEATIASPPVSLASGGNIVIGSAAAPQRPAVITAGGQQFTAHSAGFAVAGTTVAAGGSAVLLAGTEVSLGTSGILVLGSSITTLIGSSPSSLFTVGGQTLTANPIEFSIAGTILSAGGPAVLVSGTPVRLGPSGDLVIGSTTPSLPDQPHSSVFTLGDQTSIANPSKFAVAGTTLAAEGPDLTTSGRPISMNPLGSLIMGTSTIPLGNLPLLIFTTEGQTPTQESGTLVAFNSATLSDGEPATTMSRKSMRVHSNSSITGTSAVPSPAVNASISTTQDASSSNHTSTNPSPVPHTPSTSQPKAAAASNKAARAPSVICWASYVVAMVMCII